MNNSWLRDKQLLKNLFKKTLDRVQPCQLVRENISLAGKKIHVSGQTFSYDKIYLVGFGKASCTMAQGALEVIPSHLINGVVVTKYKHAIDLKGVKVIEAAHPIPDENSIKAARNIIQLLNEATSDDLVIFLISGGGSALLELPRPGITLADLKKVTDLLLRCGADINEINVVRKHLSLVKGGNLAKVARPAKFVSLIISDVIGSNLTSIASGPTVGDPGTFADCRDIFNKYDLSDKIPPGVAEVVEKGIKGEIEETPGPEDEIFKNSFTHILADNDIVCRILCSEASREKIDVHYVRSDLTTGSAEQFIKSLDDVLKSESIVGDRENESPQLLIMGGEVTLKIPDESRGMGGRNQHLSLLFTRDYISAYPNLTALFAATDGTDGPTDAAGGFSHQGVLEKTKDQPEKLSKAIENYDSYHFLKEIDELFMTGPTGNNLNDVFMVYSPYKIPNREGLNNART